MIQELLLMQKEYFKKGYTKELAFRIDQLKLLKKTIQKNEEEILKALNKDLGKPHFEGYATEVGFILESIDYFVKNLRKWAKDKKERAPFHQGISKSFIISEPYGQVLIIGPFNYPFQLLIEPMIGALAAGNTVILKPSENASHIEELIVKLIKDTFPNDYVAVITGDRHVTSELIKAKFDYIFFTGSVGVGKIVMAEAAKNLTPVTLELGGKSPVIVHKDANIEVAAKRIAWGKFLNTGQTCVAPDYIYVHSDIEEEFKKSLQRVINEFYGKDPKESIDYGRIINKRNFDRLVKLINKDKVYFGGDYDIKNLYISPTILENVTWEDKVMEDEIFGPILPVMKYESLDEIIGVINSRHKPLALYLFSENKEIQEKVLNQTSFGGGCINDTISHLISPKVPFGGVGNSGIGTYHGKYSFDTFSHKKSILKKSTRFDIKLIYPPYKNRLNIIKKVLK
ncbi:aldehyde dehydrogenase [Clostridium sediminicola]|uniref:aldehyde dehydrogenase n=1 Tax=Clostridium sediminicola TaxID=3114879 RepID=UPI0031F24D67